MHFQKNNSQAKLITVVHGKILDVVVDLRKNSSTYGKYFSIEISQNSDFSFFIPENFAHGFLCLSESCAVYYKFIPLTILSYLKKDKMGINFYDLK